MGKATKAQFTCPHAIDNGGSDNAEQDKKIWTEMDKMSDLSYEVEVIDCNPNPVKPPEPVAEPI